MAQRIMTATDIHVRMIDADFRQLMDHLFPGDGYEHGAVLGVDLAHRGKQDTYLVKRVMLAKDGTDFVVGGNGHYQLRAEFIAECVDILRDENLGYLAVHNHGGSDRVAFSQVDLRSHERGYPTLLSLLPDSPVVGALVFAPNACAGDFWHHDQTRSALRSLHVIGRHHRQLTPRPIFEAAGRCAGFDRQILMFGERGQQHLESQRIAVIGLGGVGSLLVEYLARLGVGHLVLIDPDRVERSNLPRLCGASAWDARLALQQPWIPPSVRSWAASHGAFKVDVAARVARRANPDIRVDRYRDNVAHAEIAKACTSCDFLFLAADSMQARLVFNALVHQYLIAGLQIGSKVVVDPETGAFVDAFSAIRWVRPGSGCLWCNGLISRHGLALEAKTPEERKDQAYGTPVANPSVITLNAVGAGVAANEFLLYQHGLKSGDAGDQWQRIHHPEGEVRWDTPRKDDSCPECGARFGRGDKMALPVLGGRVR